MPRTNFWSVALMYPAIILSTVIRWFILTIPPTCSNLTLQEILYGTKQVQAVGFMVTELLCETEMNTYKVARQVTRALSHSDASNTPLPYSQTLSRSLASCRSGILWLHLIIRLSMTLPTTSATSALMQLHGTGTLAMATPVMHKILRMILLPEEIIR